ncbi:hypothetical protein [Arthrobacter sp. SO3]|uniref:hypothetical protein n=1 Tax=Arthrobacter sp. SO3 TaxID=1897057 RepID=UPI001CFF77CE|nr:hypothetical protein [Arthrobacter sp. SO3]MCB5293837.1 hypothetical protein [Arthrobacter sp. SO3]
MTAEDARQVQSCEELSVGDQIEAWHNGKLFHRGEVIRTVAATDLFWILDEKTGTRRLIDAEALVILRVAVPAATYGSGGTRGSDATRGACATLVVAPAHAAAAAGGVPGRAAPDAPPARVPASHVPLFQAPSLVP